MLKAARQRSIHSRSICLVAALNETPDTLLQRAKICKLEDALELEENGLTF